MLLNNSEHLEACQADIHKEFDAFKATLTPTEQDDIAKIEEFTDFLKKKNRPYYLLSMFRGKIYSFSSFLSAPFEDRFGKAAQANAVENYPHFVLTVINWLLAIYKGRIVVLNENDDIIIDTDDFKKE